MPFSKNNPIYCFKFNSMSIVKSPLDNQDMNKTHTVQLPKWCARL